MNVGASNLGKVERVDQWLLVERKALSVEESQR